MAAALSLLSALMWGTADFLGGVSARKRSAVAIYLGSQAFGFVLLLTVVVTGMRPSATSRGELASASRA
jgi:hypothetical protein